MDRVLDLGIRNAHAHLAGALHLQAQQDQTFQHLSLQRRLRRQLVAAVGVLVDDVGDGAVELAAEDDILFDHGHHALHRRDRLRELGMDRGAERGDKQKQQGGAAGGDPVHA